MARINSQAIYVINNKINTTDSFNFGWELTKALVVPHMKERLLKGGLSKQLQRLISLFTGVAATAERPPPPDDNISRRCRMCLNETHGDGHKETQIQLEKKKVVVANAITQSVENMLFSSVKTVPSNVISQVGKYFCFGLKID